MFKNIFTLLSNATKKYMTRPVKIGEEVYRDIEKSHKIAQQFFSYRAPEPSQKLSKEELDKILKEAETLRKFSSVY